MNMDFIRDLLALFESVWNTSPIGIGAGQMLVALLIFLSFAVLRGLFARFVLRAVERWTNRTETEIDDMLRLALERPLKFFFVILGVFFAIEYLQPEGLMAELSEKVLRSLIAVGIFWTIHAAITPVSILLHRIEEILSKEILNWLLTVIRWGVLLTGAATILQIWGIQIGPIIAGFGLFGVAVALGAQDLFKNLLGGVSILIERRFKIGDWVQVEGVVEGIVEHIGFRSTRLRRFDSVPVTVPNNMFADHALINFSEMVNRRIYWQIGLEYRTTADQLKNIRQAILDWLSAHDAFIDRPCMVYVDSFNDSSIDMMVYCFTENAEWEHWLAHKQELAYAIKQIVEDAGTGFAFPSRSVYHEVVTPGAAEAFVPSQITPES